MFHPRSPLFVIGITALCLPLSVSACGSDSTANAPGGGGSTSSAGAAGTAGSGAGGGSAGAAGSSAGGGSSGGATASGGTSSGGGGASNGGATSGSGGAGGGACSTVSFHMNRGGPPPGSDFCSGPPNCMPGVGFGILDASSSEVTIGLSCGMSDCATCLATPCPPGSCHFSSPIPAAGTDLTWDGTEYARQTGCGSGAPGVPAVACYAAHCAPPGHYVAHMCAYALPANSDGGSQVCELHAASTPTCVDVPFDLPATGTVMGVLDPRK